MLTSEILQSAPIDPENELSESDMKSTQHKHSMEPLLPNLHPFHLNDGPFSSYCTFYNFLIYSQAKISKYHKLFKIWTIIRKGNILYSTMAANVLMKVGWDQMKPIVRLSFWNFQ